VLQRITAVIPAMGGDAMVLGEALVDGLGRRRYQRGTGIEICFLSQSLEKMRTL
jgi:hypothetical protein